MIIKIIISSKIILSYNKNNPFLITQTEYPNPSTDIKLHQAFIWWRQQTEKTRKGRTQTLYLKIYESYQRAQHNPSQSPYPVILFVIYFLGYGFSA